MKRPLLSFLMTLLSLTIYCQSEISGNPCDSVKISGPDHVCRGSQNQIYHLSSVECASSVEALYTGSGATLGMNMEEITISFSDDATDGNLVIQFIDTLSGSSQIFYPIKIDEGLPEGGLISGASSVCQGQNLEFYQSDINNATLLNWEYTGQGATIIPKGSGITIDFADDATGGTLFLIPQNSCGTGPTISHNIALIPLPADAGPITGDDRVCQGETVLFHTEGIAYANEYYWSYTGEGATIDGYADAEVTFGADATGGNLTVQGINECGEGKSSAEYFISMDELPKAASAIEGETVICPEEKVYNYSVTSIENAQDYIWNYTGTGAQFSGNTTQCRLEIMDGITGGKLTVSGRNACGTGSPSPSLVISVDPTCNLIIPNAFSPNNDGINDKFVIQNSYGSLNLNIFDRSGKLVYNAEEYLNDWDGTDKNGRNLPTDTYWYVLTSDKFEMEIKGYIYLKR